MLNYATLVHHLPVPFQACVIAVCVTVSVFVGCAEQNGVDGGPEARLGLDVEGRQTLDLGEALVEGCGDGSRKGRETYCNVEGASRGSAYRIVRITRGKEIRWGLADIHGTSCDLVKVSALLKSCGPRIGLRNMGAQAYRDDHGRLKRREV